jgi:hypothetical protein
VRYTNWLLMLAMSQWPRIQFGFRCLRTRACSKNLVGILHHLFRRLFVAIPVNVALLRHSTVRHCRAAAAPLCGSLAFQARLCSALRNARLPALSCSLMRQKIRRNLFHDIFRTHPWIRSRQNIKRPGQPHTQSPAK